MFTKKFKIRSGRIHGNIVTATIIQHTHFAANCNKKATRNEYGWQIVLVVGGFRERLNDSSVSLDSRINDICYIIRNTGIIGIEVESASLTMIGDNSIGLIYATLCATPVAYGGKPHNLLLQTRFGNKPFRAAQKSHDFNCGRCQSLFRFDQQVNCDVIFRALADVILNFSVGECLYISVLESEHRTFSREFSRQNIHGRRKEQR